MLSTPSVLQTTLFPQPLHQSFHPFSASVPGRLVKTIMDLSMNNNISICGYKDICSFKIKIPSENTILKVINNQW